jgi:galactose-1-phosphate uridylyltransferase
MDGPAASAELGVRLTGILQLPERLEALAGPMRERAFRLVEARVVGGRTVPPPELEPWLAATFGSVDAVREQRIVKVTNPATLESTIFSPLRARRPIDGPARADDLSAEIAATEGDPFCHPETGTPADPFGRIRGLRVVTGANAALADAHHAVVVFDVHDPLDFDAELVTDILRTGRAWAERARADDPAATNYLLIWNCLWRAGGSIVHGHAQALLGSGRHHEQIDRLRRDVAAYAARHGGDLVEELVAVHRSVGLTIEMADGVTLVANLTPRKERELLIVGSAGMEETDRRFADALAATLIAYRDRIGVRSFNLALWRPPLSAEAPRAAGWESIPPIVRLVDRGDPFSRPSDIGAMELYGTPIVGSDPYDLVEALR